MTAFEQTHQSVYETFALGQMQVLEYICLIWQIELRTNGTISLVDLMMKKANCVQW